MRLVSLLLISLLALSLIGCASGDGGDGGSETPNQEGKQKLDATMSKQEQDELSAKVKAWDPKKDKK